MKQVKVELKLGLKTYRSLNRAESLALDLDDDATVKDILNALDLIRGEVGLILVDGALAAETQEIADGATVSLYPTFGGG